MLFAYYQRETHAKKWVSSATPPGPDGSTVNAVVTSPQTGGVFVFAQSEIGKLERT
jgi:hypothetical protein